MATGNLGVPGGSSGAPSWRQLPHPRVGGIGVPANPVQARVPQYRWPDAILEGRRGGYSSDVRAVYNVGGNYLLFSKQAVPPLPGARNDYDIFCALADRLGFLAEFSEGRSDEEWLRSFVADLQAHPLDTPSGRVEMSPAAYAGTGYSPIPEYRGLRADDRYPLRLITPHPRTRTHSQCGNIPWFKERERQVLWIHPHDAAERDIEDGEEVYVRSPQGQVRIVARVTGDIMPGVVSLLEGVWPAFEPDGTDTAGSPNVLTSTVPTQPSESSRTHSVLVQVKRNT